MLITMTKVRNKKVKEWGNNSCKRWVSSVKFWKKKWQSFFCILHFVRFLGFKTVLVPVASLLEQISFFIVISIFFLASKTNLLKSWIFFLQLILQTWQLMRFAKKEVTNYFATFIHYVGNAITENSSDGTSIHFQINWNTVYFKHRSVTVF